MRRIGLLLAVAGALGMAACGGSGGGNSVGSTITSVTVSCNPSTLASGQNSQCSASVAGTGNFSSGVTWSASAGSITTAGVFTAPTVSSSTPVTVTATSTQDTSKSGSTIVTVTPTGQVSNVQAIVVDSGPQPASFTTVDEAFVTVTVCVPGTQTCQNIDHVLVDTGSSGLRLLQSLLTISLPPSNDSSGNPLDECQVFLDGFVWGPVATADIILAGERAASAHVQVILPSSGSPAVPSSCSGQTTGGNEGDGPSKLGANGILGVGLFQQDCGIACTSQNSKIPPVYYDCPASGCNPTYVTLQQQVPNPVSMFATDNNGVLIQLPAVPDGGLSNVGGSLIFGIGTQSNNSLGGATIYAVPDTCGTICLAGDIITVFNGTSYPQSFLDSGSNGIFFLNSSINGVPATCSGQNSSWYCPTPSPDNLSASNQGQNAQGGGVGSVVPVNFTIENADNLFKNNGGSNTAYSTLGGWNCKSSSPNCAFDWGLAFFFGRNVFTAIENASTPGGPGPYVAY